MKIRLDNALVARGLVPSRSQAESWISLGKVTVNGVIATKSGQQVGEHDTLRVTSDERYVSRAGLKLAGAARKLGIDFAGANVLDVGSSTGGFTDYALQHGAQHVLAVDVGTDQLHPSLRRDPRIDLREKTDIRDIQADDVASHPITIVVIDVSFISLREILPHVHTLVDTEATVLAMVKPQFEAGKHQINKGIIKNDSVRRQILKDFEAWAKSHFTIVDKADSEVAGGKGNRERFYLLKPIK